MTFTLKQGIWNLPFWARICMWNSIRIVPENFKILEISQNGMDRHTDRKTMWNYSISHPPDTQLMFGSFNCVEWLTDGSPTSPIARNHWLMLSVCRKWRPLACKVKKNNTNNYYPANTGFYNYPLKRQSWLQQTTNFASSFLIFGKIRYDISWESSARRFSWNITPLIFVIFEKATKFEIAVCCKL